MKGVLSALYSTCVYAFFFATFLYAIGFVEGVAPKNLDSGSPGGTATTVGIDLALLAVFALQHSIMARPAFKRSWTRVVPKEVERSTYVLFASVALAVLMWKWQPMPQVIWNLSDPRVAIIVRLVSFGGWAIVLLSTFLISHFQLFGVSQGFARLLGRGSQKPKFSTPLLYRWLRHPIYAGFILAFWSAPRMTLGHLVFALATTGYILIGIWLEERDLVAEFGARYVQYRQQVGMLFPRFWAQGTRTHAETSQ